MAELYVARKGFSTTRRDRRVTVQPGDLAEAGSWVLDTNGTSFEPVTVRFPAPAPAPAPQKKTTVVK